MPIIRDLNIEIDPAALLEAEGRPKQKEIRSAALWAAEHCRLLAQPALSFKIHQVERASSKGIYLAGRYLEIGEHNDLVSSAAEAVTALATLGAALEREIAVRQEQGQDLEAYMLGNAGFMALDGVTSYLSSRVEQLAATKGWGVGPVLSPGALAGWRLEDQPGLCSLAEASAVGVKVSRGFLLSPKYSLSMLIGLGPNYTEHRVGPTCRFCALGNSCQYRLHERQGK